MYLGAGGLQEFDARENRKAPFDVVLAEVHSKGRCLAPFEDSDPSRRRRSVGQESPERGFRIDDSALRAYETNLMKMSVVRRACPLLSESEGEDAATNLGGETIEGAGCIVLRLYPPSVIHDTFHKDFGRCLGAFQAISDFEKNTCEADSYLTR